MARVNYAFAKKQREQAKKAEKAAKAQRKAQAREAGEPDEDAGLEGQAFDGAEPTAPEGSEEA
jgi:hypothetical protein